MPDGVRRKTEATMAWQSRDFRFYSATVYQGTMPALSE